MRMLVCGGRDYDDIPFMVYHLNLAHEAVGITTLIEGEARGADLMSRYWAEDMDIPVEKYPAKWNEHGRRAGPIRNQQMLDEGEPEFIMAFPGGSGTKDMVTKAEAAGVPIWQSKKIFFKKEDPDLGFLSNFTTGYAFTSPDGRKWLTTEHYYQAMKTPVEDEQEWVRLSPDPGTAKKRGRQILMRDDWDTRKETAMAEALAMKFAEGTEVAKLLVATDPDYLVEYAPWGDTYWGVDANYRGLNRLGIALMRRRYELIGEGVPAWE